MSTPVMSAAEVRAANSELEDASAETVLHWAADRFGDGLVVTSSFGDPILAHLAWTVVPGVEVTLFDTQYLFAETTWYARHLASRFAVPHGGRLRIVQPDGLPHDDLWMDDTDACCAARKVQPLERLLVGNSAWVTGLRRADSSSRAATPVVQHDLLRGVVKVNPIATWTDGDVASYLLDHDLPQHPLADRGYTSIGCWPCTRPADGDDPRSGRWVGSAKTECGLHL